MFMRLRLPGVSLNSCFVHKVSAVSFLWLAGLYMSSTSSCSTGEVMLNSKVLDTMVAAHLLKSLHESDLSFV